MPTQSNQSKLDEILITIPGLTMYKKPTPQYHNVKSELKALFLEVIDGVEINPRLGPLVHLGKRATQRELGWKVKEL